METRTDEQKIIRASERYLHSLAEVIVDDLADIAGEEFHLRQPLTPRMALSEIASLKATTLRGLAAKARVVKVILDFDDTAESMEEDEFAFLRDFAEEAKAFFAKAAIEERKAARQAALEAKGPNS